MSKNDNNRRACRSAGATSSWMAAVSAAAGAVLLSACAPVMFEGASARIIELDAPQSESRVEVTKDAIVIHDKIHFEFDSDVIKPRSYDLLAEIASTIKAHPEILAIRIEGHASAEGTEEYNLDLSDRRAQSVLRHLVERGSVEEARLTSQGYGEMRPIASNDDEAGRSRNRRVEFAITKRADDSATPDDGRHAEAGSAGAADAAGAGGAS
jgi:outer membrane protein OmpA-like peptidoglycan-associated protein